MSSVMSLTLNKVRVLPETKDTFSSDTMQHILPPLADLRKNVDGRLRRLSHNYLVSKISSRVQSLEIIVDFSLSYSSGKTTLVDLFYFG